MVLNAITKADVVDELAVANNKRRYFIAQTSILVILVILLKSLVVAEDVTVKIPPY